MGTTALDVPVPTERITRGEMHAALAASNGFHILELLDNLDWFKKAVEWNAWRVFLKALYALPMTKPELEVFRKFTGRRLPPEKECKEVYVGVGRRGRKSAIEAAIMVFEACCRDHTECLAPGERGLGLVMSKDKYQAQQIKTYADAILNCEQLEHLVQHETGKAVVAETIRLTVPVDIHIRAATIVGGRSRACITAVLDEIAFFPSMGAANPDEDIIRGIRPSMATCPTSKLVCMSSPYAPKGVLYNEWERLYGNDDVDDAFFWKADTLSMHKSERIRLYVEKEYEKDPVSAAAEVGGDFRQDVQIFISPEVVNASIAAGVTEREPTSLEPVPAGAEQPIRHTYHAFVDASGGTSDSFGAAISHWDHDLGKAVLDAVREWRAPFKPGIVTKEVTEFVSPFHLNVVTGDQYAGEWPRDRFADFKFGYITSPKTKHEIYKNLLPVLNTAQVVLLDDKTLIVQLKRLERKVTPTGQERIDHPAGEHDDVVNSAAGALLMAYEIGRFLARDIKIVAPPKTTQEIQDKEMQEVIDGLTENRFPGFEDQGDLPMTIYGDSWE